MIEQLWTALGNALEILEELIAFYVEIRDESEKREAIEESGSIEVSKKKYIERS